MNENEIRNVIWQLSRYITSCRLANLSDEKVSDLLKKVFALRLATMSSDLHEIEHQIVDQCFTAVSAEARRRGLSVPGLPVEVVIDADGTFRKGEKELRRALRTLSFEEMMNFIDSLLAEPLSEAQRMTIIKSKPAGFYSDGFAFCKLYCSGFGLLLQRNHKVLQSAAGLADYGNHLDFEVAGLTGNTHFDIGADDQQGIHILGRHIAEITNVDREQRR